MNFKPIISITKFTIVDIVRQKSIIGIFIACAVFIFMVRGCFSGNYSVNGQTFDKATIAWNVCKFAFHAMAFLSIVLAALLSMRMIRRCREDGTICAMLSRQISRRQFIAATLAGTWIFTSVFMIGLQAAVMALSWESVKAIMPGYMTASLICTLNVFFATALTMFLSMYIADVAAFIIAVGIAIVGYAASGAHTAIGYVASQSGGQTINTGVWHWVYVAWPRIAETQFFAASLLGSTPDLSFNAIFPLIDIVLYSAVAAAALVFAFDKADI